VETLTTNWRTHGGVQAILPEPLYTLNPYAP